MEISPSPPYSLAQLSEASGEKERTIRSWIREGLLPPARGKGRGAFYVQEHMDRLGFIARARRELGSLPLGVLRELLDRLYESDDPGVVHRIATGAEPLDVLRVLGGERDVLRESTIAFESDDQIARKYHQRRAARMDAPRPAVRADAPDADPRPYTTIQIEPDLELRLRGDDPERVAWLARLSRKLREWIRED